MNDKEPLIPKHGGYRRLKSFQVAQLVYDLTARFCDLYVEKRSRTHDQMVQAARSGVQNIAEGSQASGTSKKTELKLTSVARASLEELRLDYEDFLRQRGLPTWEAEHPALRRFKAKRCGSLQEVRAWMQGELSLLRGAGAHGQEAHGRTQTTTRTDTEGTTAQNAVRGVVRARPCPSVPPFSAVLAANAALSLLNLCCYLLDRQLAAQAASFEREGGFTERLHRVRSAARRAGA